MRKEGIDVRSLRVKACRLAFAAGFGAIALQPVSAGQILITPAKIIGASGPFDGAIDEQTGPVSSSKTPWTSGLRTQYVTIDLGEEMSLGAIDLFSSLAGAFQLRASNVVEYNGYGSYNLASGAAVLQSGSYNADSGDGSGRLTAQRFLIGTAAKYRYLEVGVLEPQYATSLNEFRLFDRGPGGVPEPAAWAMMIGGFGLAGAAARRRRTVSVIA